MITSTDKTNSSINRKITIDRQVTNYLIILENIAYITNTKTHHHDQKAKSSQTTGKYNYH